jgi:predicted DNA-binding antitoxin AbrB/MazE fold protein
MSLTIDATYENGVLRPAQPLPLQEHQKVRITLHCPPSVPAALEAVRRGYGLLRWTGDVATLERVAGDDEFGLLESP